MNKYYLKNKEGECVIPEMQRPKETSDEEFLSFSFSVQDELNSEWQEFKKHIASLPIVAIASPELVVQIGVGNFIENSDKNYQKRQFSGWVECPKIRYEGRYKIEPNRYRIYLTPTLKKNKMFPEEVNNDSLPSHLQSLIQEHNAGKKIECTCEEFSKSRALCPVCDKEEYAKMIELNKTALKSVPVITEGERKKNDFEDRYSVSLVYTTPSELVLKVLITDATSEEEALGKAITQFKIECKNYHLAMHTVIRLLKSIPTDSPKQEEDNDKIWSEAIRIIRANYIPTLLDILKLKFTITRKHQL